MGWLKGWLKGLTRCLTIFEMGPSQELRTSLFYSFLFFFLYFRSSRPKVSFVRSYVAWNQVVSLGIISQLAQNAE